MADPLHLFDERCATLLVYLEVKASLNRIQVIYKGMTKKHTAYKAFGELISEKSRLLATMQKECPWLDNTLKVLYNHP
jgi:hypothetical protein